MLFRRRNKISPLERLRVWLWPRRSFARSAKYLVKRVLRLQGSPHALAVGVAAGVFASCTPFLGLHMVMAATLAWLFAGSVIAAAIATSFGNPVTYPLIWGASLETGRILLYGIHPGAGAAVNLRTMLQDFRPEMLWGPVLKPMAVGSLPLGLVFAVAAYFATRWLASAYQRRRRERLRKIARRRTDANPGELVSA